MPLPLYIKERYGFRKHDNPEGRLVRQIIEYLRACGAVGGKVKTTGIVRNGRYTFDQYLFRGKADIECFHKGIMYCIEVKAPGKSIKKNSDQDKYRNLFHKPPGRIFIEADSLEDISSIIK